MSWCECPNCKHGTAYNAPSGKRCIPCGYGLRPKSDQLDAEDSRRAANFLSGKAPNFRRHRNDDR